MPKNQAQAQARAQARERNKTRRNYGLNFEFVYQTTRRVLRLSFSVVLEPILKKWYESSGGDRREFDLGEPPKDDRRKPHQS